MTETGRIKVVIVGGGFGGLFLAKSLGKTPQADITLIDKRNFHLFQPLLYQVATGGLSPADIASPLRSVLKNHRSVSVVLGEVHSIDTKARIVKTENQSFSYDILVLATGSQPSYFGHDDWRAVAPGLKTVEDALEIRTKIYEAFEQAELAESAAKRDALLTFVIVGGGATGVELAGAVAEIAFQTLRSDFRHIDPSHSKIILVEGSPNLLSGYPADLSQKALESLKKLGVAVRTDSRITSIDADGVMVSHNGTAGRIDSKTVLWAAGVAASPLGRTVVGNQTEFLDRQGRVLVTPNLTLPGHPEIFVIGDLASSTHQLGVPLPGVAPVAIQQGEYVAKIIRNRLTKDTGAEPPFRYFNQGTLATIGRAAAVADFGRIHVSGLLAWLLWVFIHIMKLVGFENRMLVFVQWFSNYVTRNRGARLITGEASRGLQSNPPK